MLAKKSFRVVDYYKLKQQQMRVFAVGKSCWFRIKGRVPSGACKKVNQWMINLVVGIIYRADVVIHIIMAVLTSLQFS